MESTLIDSKESLATLIDTVVNLPSNPPSLYLDLEGINLSRHGFISIMQLMLYPQMDIYLIDIHILGSMAFTTPGSGGTTLRSILESPNIPKVFFDVRNDSNALFFHHGIALQGVQDIQLMEYASRPYIRASTKKLVHGLHKCIQTDAPITLQQKQTWKAAKDAGIMLFAPDRGGSYAVFNDRPLKKEIKAYCSYFPIPSYLCSIQSGAPRHRLGTPVLPHESRMLTWNNTTGVQDVQFMPILRQTYCNRLQPAWKTKVDAETMVRVHSSQTKAYQPHGDHKALSPWPLTDS